MTEKESGKGIIAQDEETITSSGIDLSGSTRSASFMQRDDFVLLAQSFSDAADVMCMRAALEKSPEAREHFGKAFKKLGREYEKNIEGGYFIRVRKGKTIEMPIQACLFLKTRNFTQ